MDTYILIMLPIVIAMAVLAILVARRVKRVQGIPREETEGILTKVSLSQYRGEESWYHFSYEVDGKPYNAMVGVHGAKGLSKTTPVGTKVVVCYNPNQPQDAYIELR